MLRHTGQKRTFRHNLRLAALLSLAAGFVNAAGMLAFAVLTTNVTGHAALLAIDLSEGDFRAARMVGLWLMLFLAGAFLSAFYVSWRGRDKRMTYTVPLVAEMLILLLVSFYGYRFDGSVIKTELFAGGLLFVMGMQNALVSVISGSVVRTTHLTGMFTDLGIGLSEAVSAKGLSRPLRNKLILYLAIILSFLTGGVAGAALYVHMAYNAFVVPALLILITVLYDVFRKGVLQIRHRYHVRHYRGRQTRGR